MVRLRTGTAERQNVPDRSRTAAKVKRLSLWGRSTKTPEVSSARVPNEAADPSETTGQQMRLATAFRHRWWSHAESMLTITSILVHPDQVREKLRIQPGDGFR
jgi:hypothetical protein